ncbi:hypothetical protein RCL_jg19420.t1 [Rhizophagus clarus]|uniref:Uncharacterized protein n=1 Tax=Rhizophagus clarus TaxID=94130 RepID=A0A8H3QSQ7_9GLOM|nr:hypothetical protein RCL_jg19420.t1 [Rhizophagus clarus]
MASTSGFLTRLISPESITIQVKKELVKNASHNIINLERRIIFEVDENIINNTYSNNNKKLFVMTVFSNIAKPSDLTPCDCKKLHNTVFQPIEVKFNESYTTELPSKLSTHTHANNLQDITQIQVDQTTVTSDHQTDALDIETIVVNKYSMSISQSNFSPINKKDKAHEMALHFH